MRFDQGTTSLNINNLTFYINGTLKVSDAKGSFTLPCCALATVQVQCSVPLAALPHRILLCPVVLVRFQKNESKPGDRGQGEGKRRDGKG